MIIVDTRERKGFELCESWNSKLEYKKEKLDFADYHMEGGTNFVERKAIPDVIQSAGLAKNWIRLQAECQRFADYRDVIDESATLYIMIEGSQIDMADEIVKRRRKLQPSKIINRLKELHDTYGVQIIWANDREDACIITLELLKEK